MSPLGSSSKPSFGLGSSGEPSVKDIIISKIFSRTMLARVVGYGGGAAITAAGGAICAVSTILVVQVIGGCVIFGGMSVIAYTACRLDADASERMAAETERFAEQNRTLAQTTLWYRQALASQRAANARYAELNAANATVSRQLIGLQAAQAGLNRNNRLEVDRLSAQITSLDSAKARMGDEITRLSGETDRVIAERDRLAGQVTVLETATSKLRAEQARLKAEFDKNSKTVGEIRTLATELSKATSVYINALQEGQDTAELNQADFSGKLERLSELIGVLDGVSAEALRDLAGQFRTFATKVLDLVSVEDQLSTASKKLLVTEGRLAQLVEDFGGERKMLEGVRDDLRNEITQLTQVREQIVRDLGGEDSSCSSSSTTTTIAD